MKTCPPSGVNENGTLATFHFAYESDGAVFYPDLVKVKVCEDQGQSGGAGRDGRF